MGYAIAVPPADGMRYGQPFGCLLQQRACTAQIASTKRGPTSHGSAEQLRRSRQMGCLLLRALGHIKRVADLARQQQCTDFCVSDVEPHVGSVESTSCDGISRVRGSHRFGSAPRVRGYLG
jgi:hypothetical protein